MVGGGGVPKIKYEKLVQGYDRLGLKLVDLELKDIAMKASWPCRWADRNEEELKWFFEFLPIKDKGIWECNTASKDVTKLTDLNIVPYVMV